MYIVGVQFDLLLIGHYESFWQYLPVLTLPLVLVTGLLKYTTDRQSIKMAMRVLSVALCLMGLLGIYFHTQSNFEFELELRPSIGGWELWKESLTGALPVLAPASLIPLGLLNFVISELE